MGRIVLLRDDIVSKIAAGEVVERPASVVKELVENSLDAGAKRILVRLKAGGLGEIEVRDDGEGMGPEDAELAASRHATSKIVEATDLESVKTFGFRGEALASIAAVSVMRIRTNDGRMEGTEVSYEAGKLVSKKPVVIPRGTTILVKDIFFNMPARKKHMKSVETELARAADIVTRYALSRPAVYFELVHDGRVLLSAPATTDSVGRLSAIYGHGFGKKAVLVNHVRGSVGVLGAVSVRGFERPDKAWQSLFVNGRLVKSPLLTSAVYEGYRGFLMIGRHPAFVLDIHLEPGEVDVNVHPQKMRVRLQQEQAAFDAIAEAVKRALGGAMPAESAPRKTETDLELGSYLVSREKQSVLKRPRQANVHVLGQILSTYIVVSAADGMLLVDQHAAQERVTYERYKKQYENDAVQSQELLEPVSVETTPAESVVLAANSGLMKRLGFMYEEFGQNNFLLRKVPVVFSRIQGRDVFLAIIDELQNMPVKKLDAAKEEAIIRKACKSSVKAHVRLETSQLIELVEELLKAGQPQTCPHGRPTMIKFSSMDLEKLFRRVQ